MLISGCGYLQSTLPFQNDCKKYSIIIFTNYRFTPFLFLSWPLRYNSRIYKYSWLGVAFHWIRLVKRLSSCNYYHIRSDYIRTYIRIYIHIIHIITIILQQPLKFADVLFFLILQVSVFPSTFLLFHFCWDYKQLTRKTSISCDTHVSAVMVWSKLVTVVSVNVTSASV